MKLIVDSGSTKTDWAFVLSSSDSKSVSTRGINPVVQTSEQIKEILNTELLLGVSNVAISVDDIDEIFYYGAGCIPEKSDVLKSALMPIFPNASVVEIESDLLGAARAMCGHESGVAAILGTGANSCLFDGHEIVWHTPALGYILGDEGSGAVLGRKFINGILKGWLPTDICRLFMLETGLTVADIINNVYHQTSPNRFLASMSVFIAKHIDECKALDDLVVHNFEDFIRINLLPYFSVHEEYSTAHSNAELPREFSAVGSIAYHYNAQLAKAANKYGLNVAKIIKSPLQDLVKYHCNQ